MVNVLLETRTEQDYTGADVEVQEYLVIEPIHYDGMYRVRVSKETHKGYIKKFLPFAAGNFNIRIGSGRKSAKKLEKLENYINRNKQELTDAWKAEKYQYMVDTITQDVIAEKIV